MTLVLSNPISVKYNGTDLATVDGVTLTNRKINDLPGRTLRVHKLARADGSILTTSEYTSKTLQIEGVILNDSRAGAEAALDTLRGVLAEPEGDIDISVAGTTRRWVGTLSAMSSTIKGGYCDFSIEFTCSYPFGTDPNTVALLTAASNAAGNANFPIAVEGSYKAEPYISIVYSAITGGTASTVSVYNDLDGIGLDITRDWVAGDILEIDNFNKTVQVNSVDAARVGRFFSFQPGARSIGYNDTFATSRSMTLTATYQKRYV